MPIYVLEVPHTGEPRAWVADDSADYVRRCQARWCSGQWEAFDHEVESGTEPLTAAQIVAGEDLSGYWVCDGEAEALEICQHLESDRAPRVGRCGPVVAAAALRSRLPL